jgi:hypothetical protein
MKLLNLSATAVLIYGGVALAQSTTDKPAPEVVLTTGNESKHAQEADARHCLDLKDNNAIISCAERYRRGARSSGT